MYGPIEVQSRTQLSVPRTGGLARISFRKASTADIRALLSDLKTLPQGHRRLLCKLLRRAAAHAPRKVSVVRPADSHPTMKL
jgi:hypothetical protein